MFNVCVPRNFKIAGRACNHFLVKWQQKRCFGNLKFALNENEEILPQNIKLAKTFNSSFELFTDSLEPFDWTSQLNISDDKAQNVVNFFPTILVLLKSSKNAS